MLRIIISVFIVLHGLVHLLYFGQSRRLFELQPGLVWPDGSWAFAKLVGKEGTRLLASISCILAALAFVAGATGILLKQAWWYAVVVGAVLFSSAIFIFFWDGKRQKLDAKGGVGIIINIALVVAGSIFL